MNVLIVGCGYLGMRVGALLKASAARVFASTRTEARVGALSEAGFEPVLIDTARPETLDSLPDVSHVFHCVGFDRSAEQTVREVRVDGLKRLCARLAAPLRFVYASTTGVYGQDDGGWVDESSPCMPTNESGRVGLEAEEAVRGFALATGSSSVV